MTLHPFAAPQRKTQRQERKHIDMDINDMTARKDTVKRMASYAVIAFITTAAIAAALIATGIIPLRSRNESVPCGDLTSYQSTQNAYDDHHATIDGLESIGDDVTVTVEHADCPTQTQDKGYIQITYGSTDERDRITNYLDNDGLGAYTALVQR